MLVASTPKARQAQRYADNIAACRRAKGWTHVQLAEVAGVTPRTVYRWEAAKGSPIADHLEVLEATFGKPAGWFALDHGHGPDRNQEDLP